MGCNYELAKTLSLSLKDIKPGGESLFSYPLSIPLIIKQE
ncbi:hypothetical protein SPLC1_S207230 [Arthrospira platensis C1]|nr:hypothetical protein SPLC1_S207230 [Arthrospira platensis C1]